MTTSGMHRRPFEGRHLVFTNLFCPQRQSPVSGLLLQAEGAGVRWRGRIAGLVGHGSYQITGNSIQMCQIFSNSFILHFFFFTFCELELEAKL